MSFGGFEILGVVQEDLEMRVYFEKRLMVSEFVCEFLGRSTVISNVSIVIVVYM